MAKLNLKNVRTHAYCEKKRPNRHKCYTQAEAEAVCRQNNFALYMPLFNAWQCHAATCRGMCWHVGHDHRLARAYEQAVLDEIESDLHHYNRQGAEVDSALSMRLG